MNFRRGRPAVRAQHTLLGEQAIYAERGGGVATRYNAAQQQHPLADDNLKNAMIVSMKPGAYLHEHDYTSTLQARQHPPAAAGKLPPPPQGFDPRAPGHYRRQESMTSPYSDTLVEIVDGRPKEVQHVYETPMFPDEIRGDGREIRTQSADGIARHADCRADESKSSRTS